MRTMLTSDVLLVRYYMRSADARMHTGACVFDVAAPLQNSSQYVRKYITHHQLSGEKASSPLRVNVVHGLLL